MTEQEQQQQQEEEEYCFLGVRIQIILMPKDDCGYKCQVSPVIVIVLRSSIVGVNHFLILWVIKNHFVD